MECTNSARRRGTAWTENRHHRSGTLPVTRLCYALRQVVTTPTRGKALLDKIFTNVRDWYSTPTTLPAVGSSVHAAVLMLATHNPHYKQGTDVTVTRHICDNNSKVLLANALANINWSSQYRMELCEDMTKCFYNTVNALFDEYFTKL